MILASETASASSSHGVSLFPVSEESSSPESRGDYGARSAYSVIIDLAGIK